MADHYCDRCGELLTDGSVRYAVHVHIFPDYDATCLCDQDLSDESAGEELEGQDEIDEEPFQEITFVLCQKCKQRFAYDPLNRGAGMRGRHLNIERVFH